LLILALMLAAVQAGALEAGAGSPGNLAEDLFYASMAASGSKLCDRTLAARLQRRFARRYRARIARLMASHESRFGRDPAFIVTSDCRRPAKTYDQEREFRRFEPKLRELEGRYGAP
jgi:hypothetical protein